MTRYTMPARSQGKLYAQRALAGRAGEDIHRQPLRSDDSGYGTAPGTAIDEGMPPGKPTTNTVWTAVEDYTVFEAFSEEGCATGISCTPAPHMQSERKTEDEKGEG